MQLTQKHREELENNEGKITDEQWNNICEKFKEKKPVIFCYIEFIDIYEELDDEFEAWVSKNCYWRPRNRYEQEEGYGNKELYPESSRKWEKERDRLFQLYGLALTGKVIEE